MALLIFFVIYEQRKVLTDLFMEKKIVDDLFLLAEFIQFNLKLYHDIPGETISTRKAVSQINAELGRISVAQRKLFSRLFPSIDKQINEIFHSQRISAFYKHCHNLDENDSCIIRPLYSRHNSGKPELQEFKQLVPARSSTSQENPVLPTCITSNASKMDAKPVFSKLPKVFASTWKRVLPVDRSCEDIQISPRVESFAGNQKTPVKTNAFTGITSKKVSKRACAGKETQELLSSPRQRKQESSLQALLRKARSPVHKD